MGEQVAARSNGGLAQLGEHLPCKQGVESSNLLVSRLVRKNACQREKYIKHNSKSVSKCQYARPSVCHPAAAPLIHQTQSGRWKQASRQSRVRCALA